jgi:hypothetical protein
MLGDVIFVFINVDRPVMNVDQAVVAIDGGRPAIYGDNLLSTVMK